VANTQRDADECTVEGTPTSYLQTKSQRREHVLQRSLGVMALECTQVLEVNGGKFWMVWKELCYGRTKTLGDAEEGARWWEYN
jgi:hypothetical protein